MPFVLIRMRNLLKYTPPTPRFSQILCSVLVYIMAANAYTETKRSEVGELRYTTHL